MLKLQRNLYWSASATALALAIGSSAVAAAAPGSGLAQKQVQTAKVDQQATDGVANISGEQPANNEIIVTGTLLRGAPPVGSNAISVGQEKIASTGATTANELLASVPQVSNLFNTVPAARLSGAPNQIQVVRPNLRNLSGDTSSSASTLVLFDGHRIAPVGVTQNVVDPDLIPTIAIERVEIVTDGGSATYGADAVGGVINFITRKRFDGAKVTAHYGFADEYQQYDAGAIVGRDWGRGSIFAAYTYQHNDPLFGRDRDFIRSVDFLTGLPTGRSCAPGNVRIGRTFFPLPSLTPAGAPNVCDTTDNSSAVPASTRHGALMGLHQELSDWLTVDLRAFYGERRSTSYEDYDGSTDLNGASSPGFPRFGVPPSFRNFYYTPVPGQSPTATQTVFFNFSPLLGGSTARSRTWFQEWGANAEFTAKVGENWQLRTLFNYSRSNSEYHIDDFNQTLLAQIARGPQSTVAATTINFYNPTASDLPLIRRLIDTEIAGQGKEELVNSRAILDGTLFTLPGGGVKLAVGYEFMHDGFQQRAAPPDLTISALYSQSFVPYARNINSLFGEVQVPLVGADNRMSFVHSLTLAGSLRYDHFSDFGSTVNPKIGVNLKPLSWLGFRGNYSTSFNAPSAVDQLRSFRNEAGYFPFNQPIIAQGQVPTAIGIIAIQGGQPNLRPQTAKTWSVGVDFDPPFLDGLHASANYYNVKFKDILGIPGFDNRVYINFPTLATPYPAGAPYSAVAAFLNGVPNANQILAQISGQCFPGVQACPNVYSLFDARFGNYGRMDVEGLDFAVNYRATAGFGGIDASVSGNYQLSRKSQAPGGPIVDNLHAVIIPTQFGVLTSNGSSRLALQATLGADVGHLRAQVTLNHSSGYDVVRCDPTTLVACVVPVGGNPTPNSLPQDHVDAFDTVNLFFKYAVPGESSLLRDLELTLNINNLFDTDPPLFKSSSGYANGFTLGRLVQFGIAKKF